MGQQNIAVIDATPQDEVDNIEVNENIKDDELLDEENKKNQDRNLVKPGRGL